MVLLNCNNLFVGYDGREIIHNLSFSVSLGDYLCIVGENGAGKSTLMKALVGLIKPNNGEITFGDGLNHCEIGYLPQQSIIQRDFPASVWEIVISGFQNRLGLRPFYNKCEKEEALININKMGISHLVNRCYRELSGGQQQRVLLARALCATKKMLLLDEPVAGLDPIVTNEMYELIYRLNKEDNICIIMISHDIESALKYADHILHIGKNIFYGTKEDYLKTDCANSLIKIKD